MILVVGSTNTDMVVKAPRIPVPGETILGGKFLMNPGGKGANQAVAAARLSGQVAFVAKVGDDLFGQETYRLLEREGIDATGVTTDKKEASGVALIMVDAKGENCISVASGANAKLAKADFDRAVKKLGKPSILLAQLETPIPTIAAVAAYAQKNGIPFILNPAPAAKLPAAVYKGVSLITPNETEAELLTGVTVTDEASAEKAAKALRRKGVKQVIITMGSAGSYVFDGKAGVIVPAKKVKAVDTTAAGDVYNGALAVALSEGAALADAVVFATKAAAISVTRMGAQASAPYRKEVK